MIEADVDCVSSFACWVYFRKKAVEGPFNIYSDIDSRVRHYNRIVTIRGSIGGFNLMVSTNDFINRLSQDIHTPFFYISILNVVAGGLLVGGSIPYICKIRRLKKENLLKE